MWSGFHSSRATTSSDVVESVIQYGFHRQKGSSIRKAWTKISSTFHSIELKVWSCHWIQFNFGVSVKSYAASFALLVRDFDFCYWHWWDPLVQTISITFMENGFRVWGSVQLLWECGFCVQTLDCFVLQAIVSCTTEKWVFLLWMALA
jgi:hypothetical protein